MSNGIKADIKKHWRHMGERERYQMEYMLKKGVKVSDIAKELGFSRSTIYAERKRGTIMQKDTHLREFEVYVADYAQRDYDAKKHAKGRWLKIGNDIDFIEYVERKIKCEKYSPLAVLMSIDEHMFKTKVCQRTLYSYIHRGVFSNLNSSDLPYKVKKKKNIEKKKVALKNVKGRSIELRSADISERNEYGHWEMDTVYSGKNKSKSCLLVLTERQTRMEEIYFMEDRTQKSVCSVMDSIEERIGLKKFMDKYKTITMDNGVEFLDYNGIENSKEFSDKKRTVAYYCHPFCSSERGSNENQNKLIRRWIPKGEDIGKYQSDIPFIQDWINSYPRKLFDGKSSMDVYLSLF